MSADSVKLLLFLVWVFGGATIVALALIAVAGAIRGSYRRALRSVAQEFRGTLFLGGLDNVVDQVTFQYRSAAVRVLHTTVHGHTQVLISSPNPALRLELAADEPFNLLQKLIGMQDIVVGNPAFDGPYVVRGDDEVAVRQFLTPAVQAAAINLLAFKPEWWARRHPAGLHVQLGPELLVISRGFPVSDADELLGFVRASLAFYDAAIGAVTPAGIEFVESKARTVPHCMVCGEALLRDVVYCRRCKTPHHREC